jgi:hypothetical protein
MQPRRLLHGGLSAVGNHLHRKTGIISV